MRSSPPHAISQCGGRDQDRRDTERERDTHTHTQRAESKGNRFSLRVVYGSVSVEVRVCVRVVWGALCRGGGGGDGGAVVALGEEI